MPFVQDCIRLGVDGFYASTQGGEASRLGGTGLFQEYVKPSDLVLMKKSTALHLQHPAHLRLDAGYDDLSPFLDYPGHVVNCSLRLGDGS